MFGLRLTAAAIAIFAMAAAPYPTLPGVGPDDPRMQVDAQALPWSALARLQSPGVSRCTAVLLAPRLALTAAHCLYSRRLGHFVPAASVHLLSHYADGDFAAHSVAATMRIASGYDPTRPDATRASDAALLTLATPLQADTLALAGADPPQGAAAMLGGYSQDRAEIISADRSCHVTRTVGPAGLLHDCAATRGTSGAPVLVQEPGPGQEPEQDGAGPWRVAGIAVGALAGRNGGIAVPLAVLRRLLATP